MNISLLAADIVVQGQYACRIIDVKLIPIWNLICSEDSDHDE
jgi:hypothetical protein